MNKPTSTPIPYKLALLEAIQYLLELKAELARHPASLVELHNAYDFLRWWSDNGEQPAQACESEHLQSWITSVIDIRRSPAARLDPFDHDDDGLEWLTELLSLVDAAISDPGDSLNEMET